MKKVTKKHIFLGILAVCVACCLVVYMLVYNKYQTETETLKASNDALQIEVDDLKVYYDKMDYHNAEIIRMTKFISDQTSDYQNRATEEDVIKMAIDMQNEATVLFKTINIDSAEKIQVVAEDVVAAADIEGYEGEIVFTERQASYQCSTIYEDLKKCIDVVYDNPHRVGIQSVNFKKQSPEHNQIEGIITLSYYAVEGMNKPYEYPDLLEYTTSNTADGPKELFGKIIVDGYEGSGSTTGSDAESE